jgi:hypothetical protein
LFKLFYTRPNVRKSFLKVILLTENIRQTGLSNECPLLRDAGITPGQNLPVHFDSATQVASKHLNIGQEVGGD